MGAKQSGETIRGSRPFLVFFKHAFTCSIMDRVLATRQADTHANRCKKTIFATTVCMVNAAVDQRTTLEEELRVLAVALNTLQRDDEELFLEIVALERSADSDTEEAFADACARQEELQEPIKATIRRLRAKESEVVAAQKRVEQELKMQIAVLVD